MQIHLRLKAWPFWPKILVKPILFTWLALSVLGALVLLPASSGKAPASLWGGSTIGPQLWQHQWWAFHKIVALLGQVAWWQWVSGIILLFGWGMLLCFCLGRGLGHGRHNYLPSFQPCWWGKVKLLALRSATTLFALGAGAFLFMVPLFFMVGAMSFWPDTMLAGLTVILLWVVICVVYIFPCIWADVLIVCHSPIPAQWPSNELYHRFLGAVSSHWRLTKSFVMAGGILLAMLVVACGLQSLGHHLSSGDMALLNMAIIFITGLMGLILAYHFGRQVARDEAPALAIIRESSQAI